MMEQKHYKFVLVARTPIAHHSETIGNSALLMRRKTRQPDGSWADVPVVTGDTMRHGMREAAAYAVLDAAGLLDTGRLSEAALRLLFAGGMVTGRGDASVIKLDAYREMCELVPPLALFGGCADNRVIPGRLIVSDAVLVCDETVHQLPEWLTNWMHTSGGALDTCRAHVEEEQRVRMDPTLDPGKRKLLAEGDQVGIEKRLLASETAATADDAPGRQEAKSSMMPRRFERVAQGSLFYWAVTATCYSELDVDTFHSTLAAFLANAWVGGKKGTGHGHLVPVTARQCAVLRPSQVTETIDVTELATRVGSLFVRHVKDRAERIASFFATVNA